MTDRIIELSENPVYLGIDTGRLMIKKADGQTSFIPLSDIAVVVCAHPAVTLTHNVLSELTQHGAMFLVCDGKRLPAGMVLPMDAHHLQAELFRMQVDASQPTRKRLWQQVVKAKIMSQARTLEMLYGDDSGLTALTSFVRSGDPDNIEGRAARRYWPQLFADSSFTRDQDAENQNRLLNYGYMVTRAIIARAVCAAGLHPSFGLHHHNRYDAFALADDLMEPFRCLTDRAVVSRWCVREPKTPFDRQDKTCLLEALLGKFDLGGERRTVFDIAARMAISLAAVFRGNATELVLPEF